MHPYTLIRSSRRTLALQISQSGDIIVRAPMRYSVEKIEGFLHAKSSWIAKHQSDMQVKKHHERENRGYYFLFGEQYERGEQKDEAIIALSKLTLRTYVLSRIEMLSLYGQTRRPLKNIRINSARTRWGSCSSLGNISFSYRLVAYPRETIDAVIVHELAHLTHADHSARFWSLVYEHMSDYDKYILPLKKISPKGEIG